MPAEPRDPANFSIEDLRDPTLNHETLRQVAAVRPDLWPAILDHPNTSPELAHYIREEMRNTPPSYEQQPPPQYGDQPGQYGHYQAPSGYPSQTEQAPLDPNTERIWGIFIPLGALFFTIVPPLILSFLPPLIIWLVFKNRSPLLDALGRRTLNWTLSYLVYSIVAGILTFAVIGAFIWTALVIVHIVFCIIAAVKANNRQPWKFPLSIPFVSVSGP